MQRRENDEVTLVYEDPVPNSVGPGDSASESYGADGLRTAKNDDLLYHSNRFRPWWEEESALSNQPDSERLEMNPESLKDRIKWYHHLVSTRAPLSKLSQHSRSKVHWNEMIDLSREHEHHVDRLRAIRHEINNANKLFPSDFKLSPAGEMIQSRESCGRRL